MVDLKLKLEKERPLYKQSSSMMNYGTKQTVHWLRNTFKRIYHSGNAKQLLGDFILPQTEWLRLRKQKPTNASKDFEKCEISCTVTGSTNWYRHCGNLCDDSLKSRSRSTVWPSHTVLCIYPRTLFPATET